MFNKIVAWLEKITIDLLVSEAKFEEFVVEIWNKIVAWIY